MESFKIQQKGSNLVITKYNKYGGGTFIVLSPEEVKYLKKELEENDEV